MNKNFVEIGHNAYWGTREEGKFSYVLYNSPFICFQKNNK